MNIECDSDMTRALIEQEADRFCAQVFTPKRRITTAEAHDLAAHIAAWTMRMVVDGGHVLYGNKTDILAVADGLASSITLPSEEKQ